MWTYIQVNLQAYIFKFSLLEGLKNKEHPNRSSFLNIILQKKELCFFSEVIDYNAEQGTCKVSLDTLENRKTGRLKNQKEGHKSIGWKKKQELS